MEHADEPTRSLPDVRFRHFPHVPDEDYNEPNRYRTKKVHRNRAGALLARTNEDGKTR